MKVKDLETLSITVLRADTKVKRSYNIYNFYLQKRDDGKTITYRAFAQINGENIDEKKGITRLSEAKKHFNSIRDKYLKKIK